MSFKILAMRPLKGCSDDIANNLKKDEFYFFDDAYEQDGDLDFIKKKEDYRELSSEFYYQRDFNSETQLESINIQAIVGKNGSGKSSVVEFLFRMLNNFFKQSKIANISDQLIFCIGVKGELYFEKDSVIYKITVDSTQLLDSISYSNIFIDMRTGIKEEDVLFTSDKIVSNEEHNLFNVDAHAVLLQPLSSLFFTIYMNYSIYSLDEIDYKKESYIEPHHEEKLSWLSSIVHKNDGYQTPLAIHPHRKEGNIIVRNEKMLLKQRLSSLVFVNDRYREIIGGFYIAKVQLFRNKNFLSGWFDNIFLRVYKLEDIEEESYYSNGYEGGSIKKETVYDNDNLQSFISQENKLRLLNLVFSFFKANEELFDYFNFISIDNQSFYKENTLSEVIDKYFSGLPDKDGSIKEKISLIKIAVRYFNKENIFELIKICWLYSYFKRQNRFRKFSLSNEDNLINDLISYYLIKALKILKYDKYNEYEVEITMDDILEFDIISLKFSYDQFIEFIKEINLEDDNHITIKLNQCLSLLEYISINPNNKLVKHYNKSYNNSNSSHFIDIDNLKEAILEMQSQIKKELIFLLPPSIFRYDFMSENEKDTINLDKISSGQFQKIALLSSISYHLRNIDSIKGNDRLENLVTFYNQYYSYENILIILDEIELYAHPEQQRVFISDLIDIIKSESFKKITNINIIFITHSPFILSDIPSQNVLKLEEGKVVAGNDINSFGANIHDLLADEFFLEKGFMGDFAEKKINDFILLLSWKILYENFIDLIADLQDNDKQKKYVDNFELPYSGKKMEDLEFKKLIEENRELKKIWLSKQDIEFFLPIKESKVTNIANYINSLKDEILLFINTIGEPLIKLRLIEMFNDSFRPNEQTELERLLKERDILSKKIEKLESK
ncbi:MULTISPECIES: hypothetical protein [unclassified Myroides]|uniref:hypothetical protein n=1 Tax=unclassified Myroides TaxID=2642485 RepID=UPI003D2F973E